MIHDSQSGVLHACFVEVLEWCLFCWSAEIVQCCLRVVTVLSPLELW